MASSWKGGKGGVKVYSDGTRKRPGYNQDGTKRKERRGKPPAFSQHRIVWKEGTRNAYVYDGLGHYHGSYAKYRQTHPGKYTQLTTTEARLKLTRAQVQYLIACDQMAPK